MKAKILMSRSNTIGGKLIRIFTWSNWNHVGIEVNGSVFDSNSHRGVGVGTLKQFKEKYDDTASIEVDLPRPEDAMEFLMSQRGKEYDWSAIFGFAFRKNWDNGDRWFCSELVFCALAEGGVKIPNELMNKAHRFTPRDVEILGYFLRKRDMSKEDKKKSTRGDG